MLSVKWMERVTAISSLTCKHFASLLEKDTSMDLFCNSIARFSQIGYLHSRDLRGLGNCLLKTQLTTHVVILCIRMHSVCTHIDPSKLGHASEKFLWMHINCVGEGWSGANPSCTNIWGTVWCWGSCGTNLVAVVTSLLWCYVVNGLQAWCFHASALHGDPFIGLFISARAHHWWSPSSYLSTVC